MSSDFASACASALSATRPSSPQRVSARSSCEPDSSAGDVRIDRLLVVRMHARRRRCACLRPVTRRAISTASAAAEAPSYIEALATPSPKSSQTIVWNSKIACSVPCEISG